MTSKRIEQAEALVAEVRAALDAAELTAATVTLNAGEIPSGARHGIIVVSPPKLDFTSWGDPAAEFELHAIAGPPDNYLAAWAVLDQLIQALVDGGVNLRSGEPGGYAAPGGATLPAYTLTVNDPE